MNVQSGYSQSDYGARLVSPQEQVLYDHWLGCVDSERPDVLINRFNTLFIDGTGYGDYQVVTSLDKILLDSHADMYFHHILNRCCHILINRWQKNRDHQPAIAELVSLFEYAPSHAVREVSRARSVRRLREIVSQFRKTEQYLMLKRLVQVMERDSDPSLRARQPLGTLIGRYPYLYEHCLLSEESPKEQQTHVRRMQHQAQKKVELDLSQYVNYRVRRSRLKREGLLEKQGQWLRPSNNPTLLSDRELVDSLQQFSGRDAHGRTYNDLALKFRSQCCETASFKSFKDDFYEYLVSGVDPAYGRQHFNNALYQNLKDIYPENDNQRLNDFLLVRTCSNLFNFLVVDPAGSHSHFVFIDLINNLGATLTTGLLLRILLLCRKVKPYLERRLSTLFNHYELAKQDSVGWLVKILETLNLALSLTFGHLDISHTFA
ncbi:hypothetical protein D0962_13675 [Leptolyngbyaceae cyanobacterium CCMR0082]|uniref:Uncharacterized protein n=2 Tax=Adonisia turfae TaxID=2950184 RepID=A0A6M0S6W7_9CYAN|nr:hypothetical protein [Leptothoe sp. LEGE 181152]NEZ56814.1 hypothetical protein [Adonisia turfae CCMR0081]NEZ63823.1 hypothetical protein [Adonisia turfae CCMR0082]